MKKMRHFFLLFCSSGDEGERGGENVRVGIVEGEIRRLWVRVAVIVLTARAVCVVVEKEEIGCRESREVGFCWWGKGDPNPGSGIRGSDSFCKNLGYCPNDLQAEAGLRRPTSLDSGKGRQNRREGPSRRQSSRYPPR